MFLQLCTAYLLLKVVLTKELDKRYHYTKVAKGTDGISTCLGDCIKGLCAINPAGHRITCTLVGTPAPRFHTNSRRGNNGYCLSNCARYGGEHEWCLTGYKLWDHCNTADHARLTNGVACEGPCEWSNLQQRYWCKIAKYKVKKPCVPPAEMPKAALTK